MVVVVVVVVAVVDGKFEDPLGRGEKIMVGCAFLGSTNEREPLRVCSVF